MLVKTNGHPKTAIFLLFEMIKKPLQKSTEMAISVAFLCSGFLYEELKRYSICILIVSCFFEVVKDTTKIFSKNSGKIGIVYN